MPFMPATLDAIRNTRPTTKAHLWDWVYAYTGIRIARTPVCKAHQPPFEFFAKQWFDQPNLMLVLGARGSGKSFLEAILTHMESRFNPRLGTRILGGSKAQSLQIYDALTMSVRDGNGSLGSDCDSIRKLLKTEAEYRNGSNVSILAASSTSVRGPHVPRLRLDEVDEIDDEIRQASMGMCMAKGGHRASVSLTSTWHRLGGPMQGLLDRGRSGEFPTYTCCTFEVLERCPESRSGPYVGGQACYERCPGCPIVKWCHAERDLNGGVPLAKLSDGHYAIDSLIQKIPTTSLRIFEADYLCKGPKADGVWFPQFDDGHNVSVHAEYEPRLPVHLSIDSGVCTGAVAFQVRQDRGRHLITVFADHFAEGQSAESNGLQLLELLRDRRGTRLRLSTDPAGGSRNPVGPTVIGEYERVGLRPLERWPVGPVADSLALLEGLVRGADGSVSLLVHPRCRHLIQAMKSYRRAKRGGQWQDYPEDPQHPAEDLVDALRGGLKLEFPEGRTPKPNLPRRPAGSII
ncbi:hypothetical protein [Singulisphaera sp. PoT]|uniref:hypothetical protein n=1 Tax=Singulisphaera sp. PoT TaxID=3411797 RepID=UPI003BF61C83